MCEKKMQRVLVGKYERMRPLGRFRHRMADDKKWILKKQDVMAETRLCGSGQEQVEGSCTYCDEASGSVKCSKFLYELRN
jgi:hypothetical protein